MIFEWDEDKRIETIRDRGLDFGSAWRFFDGRPAVHVPRVPAKVDGKPPRSSKVRISRLCGCGAAGQCALSRSGEPMATKKKRIVRYTTDELRKMEKAGKVRSDWKRAAKMPVPDGSNLDDAIEPVRMDWATTTLPARRRKAHASLRLDADMLDWFRAQGRGYQTKINAILRSYFEHHTR
jgi:uncharacterized protein (DUF4415 family)